MACPVRGNPPKWPWVVPALSEKNLSQAAEWLEKTSRYLRTYHELPSAQREQLARFAREKGIDPPELGKGTLDELLVALGQIEERIPVRPSEELPEQALLALYPVETRTVLRGDELLAAYRELSPAETPDRDLRAVHVLRGHAHRS